MVVMLLLALGCASQEPVAAASTVVIDEITVSARRDPAGAIVRVSELEDPLLRTGAILALMGDPSVSLSSGQAAELCALSPAEHTRAHCFDRYQRSHLDLELKAQSKEGRPGPAGAAPPRSEEPLPPG